MKKLKCGIEYILRNILLKLYDLNIDGHVLLTLQLHCLLYCNAYFTRKMTLHHKMEAYKIRE